MSVSARNIGTPYRVGLVVESSNEYARGILRGISSYTQDYGPWVLQFSEHGPWSPISPGIDKETPPPDWLESWEGDGIVARIENRAIAEAVMAKGIPVVDVSAGRLVPSVPTVETDNRAVANRAFEHLHQRGFRSLAFVGDGRFDCLAVRRDEFSRLCEDRELEYAELEVEPTDEPVPAAWLHSLPRPLGILAGHDRVGRRILEGCRAAGLAVPEEVAVLGVDDDHLVCTLSHPPLSSVTPATEKIGHEAARILHAAMQGQAVEPVVQLVPPMGVTTRRSTDTSAMDDPEVARVMNLIRLHTTQGIKVTDVLRHVPVSRRVFEARFRAVTGRTLHQQIVHERTQLICRLLVSTDLTLSQIAASCGFRHVEYMTVFFKREVGVAPSEYRQRGAGDPE